MPTKPSPQIALALSRTKLSELTAQFETAEAAAEADRRIAEKAKAEAKRVRKIYKQARKAAKTSRKKAKALRGEIEQLTEQIAAAPEVGSKKTPKATRPKKEITKAEAAPRRRPRGAAKPNSHSEPDGEVPAASDAEVTTPEPGPGASVQS